MAPRRGCSCSCAVTIGSEQGPRACKPRSPGMDARLLQFRGLCQPGPFLKAGRGPPQLQGDRASASPGGRVVAQVHGPGRGPGMGPGQRPWAPAEGHGHQPRARGVRAGLACWLWALGLLHGSPRHQSQGHGHAQCPMVTAGTGLHKHRPRGRGRCWRWRLVLGERKRPAAGVAGGGPWVAA